MLSTYELGHQPLHVASPAALLRRVGHDVRCLDLSVLVEDDADERAAAESLKRFLSALAWESLGVAVSVRFWDALLERYVGAAAAELGDEADVVQAQGRQLSFEAAAGEALAYDGR